MAFSCESPWILRQQFSQERDMRRSKPSRARLVAFAAVRTVVIALPSLHDAEPVYGSRAACRDRSRPSRHCVPTFGRRRAALSPEAPCRYSASPLKARQEETRREAHTHDLGGGRTDREPGSHRCVHRRRLLPARGLRRLTSRDRVLLPEVAQSALPPTAIPDRAARPRQVDRVP